MIELRIRVAHVDQLADVFPDGLTVVADFKLCNGDLIAVVDHSVPAEYQLEPRPLIGPDDDFSDPPAALPAAWTREANRRPYDIEPEPTPPAIESIDWTAAQLDAAIIDILRDGPCTYSEITDVLDADLDTVKDRMRHLADIRKVETAGVKGWKLRRRNFDAEAARFAAAEAL